METNTKTQNYPYCNNCDSCGHDGCCSYIKCIFDSINRSEDCLYTETTKAEVMLRHYFYNYIIDESEDNPNKEIRDFVDKVFDKAYAEAYPEPQF